VSNALDPDAGDTVDQCVVTFFRGPHSYTGEDLLEIGCHGGRVTPRRVLSALLSAGCRLADPGEFSKRAFLNGKLGLAEAEAVSSLITANSDLAQRNALRQLEGRLGQEAETLACRLRQALVHLEASLDFEEEEVPSIQPDDLLATLDDCAASAQSLADTWEFGQALQQGLHLVLAGKPNTGKSSLLNCLLGEERAIVTDTPGTTRDVLEGAFSLGGLPVTLLDTAGITRSKDPIERIGVARALSKLASADAVILVADASRSLDGDDRWCAELLQRASCPVAVALNKSDLPQVARRDEVAALAPGAPVTPTCALDGSGVDRLKEAVGGLLTGNRPADPEGTIIVSLRQRDALARSAAAGKRAAEALRSAVPLDMVCADVREALSAIGEITGETVTEDLLSAVFAQFCIGK
jgi:tRNA modification GTPase